MASKKAGTRPNSGAAKRPTTTGSLSRPLKAAATTSTVSRPIANTVNGASKSAGAKPTFTPKSSMPIVPTVVPPVISQTDDVVEVEVGQKASESIIPTPDATKSAPKTEFRTKTSGAAGTKSISRPISRSESGSISRPQSAAAIASSSATVRGVRQELRMRQRAALKRRQNGISALLVLAGLIGVAAIVLAIMAQNGAFNPPPVKPTVLTIAADLPGVQFPIKNIKPTPKVTTLDGGLQIMDVKVGTGAAVKATDTLTVNYTGWLTNGTKFDSSVDPTFGHVKPAQFPLSGVIEGWKKGLVDMQVGGVRRLYIPAALAYGDNPPQQGSPIQAGSTLIFEVELKSIP